MQRLGEFCVGAEHPSLPGHFPGRPVVPGVVLLDEVLALLLQAHPARVLGFPQVKFLRPVLPGDVVTVEAVAPAAGRTGFVAIVAGQEVLRGSVSLATP